MHMWRQLPNKISYDDSGLANEKALCKKMQLLDESLETIGVCGVP